MRVSQTLPLYIKLLLQRIVSFAGARFIASPSIDAQRDFLGFSEPRNLLTPGLHTILLLGGRQVSELLYRSVTTSILRLA